MDECRFSLDGFEVWYRVVGDLSNPPAGKLPLLARSGRLVVFYD